MAAMQELDGRTNGSDLVPPVHHPHERALQRSVVVVQEGCSVVEPRADICYRRTLLTVVLHCQATPPLQKSGSTIHEELRDLQRNKNLLTYVI